VTTAIGTTDIDGIAPRFVVDSIGRPVIVSHNFLGAITIDIPWWVTP